MDARRITLTSLALAVLAGCGDDARLVLPVPRPAPSRSSSIVVTADGKKAFVVNADADSVSEIDVGARMLAREISLADAPPAVGSDGSFTPSVMPRALALSSDGSTLFVSGERSGKVYAIDVGSGRVTRSGDACSEPIGVVPAVGDGSVYVACSQDAVVARLDPASLAVTATVSTPAKPWMLAWSADGSHLLATHLLGPGVTAIDPVAMTAKTWTVPDVAPRGEKRLAHGQVRGIYDVVARPNTRELWTVHTLLATDTAQPDLDFESTVFPAASILHDDGAFEQTLSTNAQDVPGYNGSFADIVSAPHSIAFTSDGGLALVVDTASEDVLAIDPDGRLEATLLRPLPGHMPEGIAIAPGDGTAFIEERNTGDVAVVKIDRTSGAVRLSVDGDPIARLAKDPMPADLRLGQHLFFSANSDEYPISTNHWVACSSCHLEGRSDAVTWRFTEGPRDTPSNAGGMLGTGFLFRTADRNKVEDYFRTINIEQGGHFDPNDPEQADLLKAVAGFVNHALPLPKPPATNAALVAKGKEIFERTEVLCSTCHTGPRFTDSGSGNDKLDLSGMVLLHDVGTCVTTPFPDVAHDDVDGDPREPCEFDTPSLNGVADSAPYLHDGSAATIRDVLEKTRGKMGDISSLSEDDLDALVEYVRSL